MYIATRGFTLIEILVVLTIMTIIVGFSLAAISSSTARQEIERSVTTITQTLTETRQRTLAAETTERFGVAFSTSSVSWFMTPYDPSTAQVHNLPGVEITYSFTHGEDAILFSRLRGEVTATGTVTVRHPRADHDVFIYIDRFGRYTLERQGAD